MKSPLRMVLVVALAGCGGAAANGMSGSLSAGPMPAGGEWTGVYYSDWGRLEMQQTGDTVVGEFRQENKRGNLSGTVNGNLLTFTFRQNDETIPSRPRTFQGSGQFQYYIDELGDHKIRGTWGYGSAYDDGGPWNGSRSRRAQFQFLTTGGARRTDVEGDTAGGEGGEGGEQPPPEEPAQTDDLGDL